MRHPSGLSALEFNFFISQFAASMVGAFGVLFIFHLGGDLPRGLFLVAVFFGLQRVLIAGSIPLIGRLTARLGYRRVMSLATIALALKLWIFTLVPAEMTGNIGKLLIALFPAIAAGAAAIAGYYLSYHAMFLDDNDDRKLGEQIGTLGAFGSLAAITSPLLSGLLIDRSGFSVMFFIAIGILLLSIIPLELMPRHRHHGARFSIRKAARLLSQERRTAVSVIGWILSDGILIFFWPVYFYLVIRNYSTFGALSSIVLAVNAAMVIVAGKIYDRRPLRRVFPLAAIAGSVLFGLRFISPTPATALSADAIGRMVNPLWWMKIRRRALEIGERTDSLVFGAVWEFLLCIGYVSSLALGLFLLWFFKWNWAILAIPAILGIALAVWATRRE